MFDIFLKTHFFCLILNFWYRKNEDDFHLPQPITCLSFIKFGKFASMLGMADLKLLHEIFLFGKIVFRTLLRLFFVRLEPLKSLKTGRLTPHIPSFFWDFFKFFIAFIGHNFFNLKENNQNFCRKFFSPWLKVHRV